MRRWMLGGSSGEHVDVFGRTLRQVKPAVRTQLLEETAKLVMVAEQSTPDEFARTVRQRARALERDGDGLERLERQRRAIRMNAWTDKGHRDGPLVDRAGIPTPRCGWRTRLDAQVEALFHDTHPDGCPTDLLEKQAYLRAHALRHAPRRRRRVAGLAARGCAWVVRRSSSSKTTPTRDPTADPPSTGVSTSTCPTSSSNSCARPPTCTPSRSATVSSSKPPANSTSAAPPGWPTAPNDEPCAACTRPVRSPAAASATSAPSCTTSSGGAHGGMHRPRQLLTPV